MRTIEPEGWGAVWRRDMATYDAASVIAAVDEESVSVRCEKITAYLDEHVGDLFGKRTVFRLPRGTRLIPAENQFISFCQSI